VRASNTANVNGSTPGPQQAERSRQASAFIADFGVINANAACR